MMLLYRFLRKFSEPARPQRVQSRRQGCSNKHSDGTSGEGPLLSTRPRYGPHGERERGAVALWERGAPRGEAGLWSSRVDRDGVVWPRCEQACRWYIPYVTILGSVMWLLWPCRRAHSIRAREQQPDHAPPRAVSSHRLHDTSVLFLRSFIQIESRIQVVVPPVVRCARPVVE